MAIESYHQMLEEVGKQYSKKPRAGWKVFIKGVPQAERAEIFISDGKDTYYAKTFPFNPRRVTGRAIKMEGTPIEEKVPYPSGLRRLDKNVLEELMKNGGLSTEQISRILSTQPVKAKKVKKSGALVGPLYFLNKEIKDLADISPSQKRLVETLNKEVERLERRHLEDYIR
jgi:hypothetical protein